MEDNDLVAVFEADSEVQALLYRSVLEEAGIDVEEEPMEASWMAGVRYEALHSRLLVSEADAPRATKLIDEYREDVESGALTLEEDEEE